MSWSCRSILGVILTISVPPSAEADTIRGRIHGVSLPEEVVVFLVGAERELEAPDQAELPDADADYKIDQIARKFVPFVLAIPRGARIFFHNSEDDLHNIHAKMGEKTLFNIGMPPDVRPMPQRFNESGDVRLGCDRHLTMEGWIKVLPHRYFAQADDAGSYVIEDVPPGHYEIAAWHPYADAMTLKRVTIIPNQTASVDFVLEVRE